VVAQQASYQRLTVRLSFFTLRALRSAATIEPTGEELRVTLAPLSSPHRSRAIAAVCDELNKTQTLFPGSKLRLRYAVAQPPIS